jgi:glutamate racemase
MNSKAELPIGIFDSGVGGLTVVRQIHRLLPHEELIYLGDTARVPYGTKSPTTVVRFATEITQFLEQQQVKAVVVACNTVSAWALPSLQNTFDMPILGVIQPGVEAAVGKTRTGRIGIIGTAATIRSQAYERAILFRNSEAQVFARSCPLLVPLVEEGWVRHPVTKAVLEEYLAPLLRKHIDTLVLGCTHYPLLKHALREIVGPEVALVDSAESCARSLEARLESLGLLSQNRQRAGRIQPFVTDETDRFNALAPKFLGMDIEPAWKIDLQSVFLSSAKKA